MSSVNREIAIKTKEGCSYRFVQPNRYIETLVSMYDMGEVPDEIVLEGSVADIVNEEGEAWIRSIRLASELLRGIGTKKIATLLNLDPQQRYRPDHKIDRLGAVYLHEVSRICRIFDMNDSDYIGILVDERTPRCERMAYYHSVGQNLWKNEQTAIMYFHYSQDICLDAVSRAIVLLNNHVVNCENKKLSLDEDKEEDVYVLLSIVYVALMESRRRGIVRLVQYILWDDLIEVAKKYNKDDSAEMKALYFFSGNKDPERSGINSLDVIIRCPLPTQTFVYERAIKWIADDVSPIDLGLNCIVEEEAKAGDIWYMSLGYFIKTYSRDSIDAWYKDASMRTIRDKRRVAKLEKRLSRSGLVKILLCLLHHIEKDKKNNTPKVDAFTRAIERYLESN